MDKQLSNQTKRLLDMLNEDDRLKLIALFHEDGALYGPPTAEVLERVQFAAIKLSMQGEYDLAAQLFRVDTRDLLVAAGFANGIHAHEIWYKSVFAKG